MILSFNANGDIQTLVPERIYQGSNNANTISVVAPFPTTTTMQIKFKLPDGSNLEPKLLVNGKYFFNGINIWSFLVTKDVTKYFGNIKLQVDAINLPNGVVDGTEIVVATGSTSFLVEEGVATELPEVPETTTYLQIAQLLQGLSQTKVDRVDINNVPVGIEYNLNGYKTPNAFYYNPSINAENEYILVTSYEISGEPTDINQLEWKFGEKIEFRNLVINGETKEVKEFSDWKDISSDSALAIKSELEEKITINTNDIAELETKTSVNTENIMSNVESITRNTNDIIQNTIDIATNTADIEYLKQNIGGGGGGGTATETYIGKLTGNSLPSDTRLSDYVRQIKGRSPLNGDIIIYVLEISGATDKNYKYIYGASGWSYYELPPVEAASNGSLGIVKGTYGIGSANTTQVDISNGSINRIFVRDNSNNVLTSIDTLINSIKSQTTTNTSNIAENTSDISENTRNITINTNSIGNINDTITTIKNGGTIVGKADIAIKDSFGNNIANTYQTTLEGASKNYVREYALPRTFNDIYYVSANGYETTVPTEPLDGVQFTANVSSINYMQLALINKIETSEYELSEKNSYSTHLYISADRDVANLNILLTTYYKKLGEINLTILDTQTKTISLSSNSITKVEFSGFMTSLNNSVIDVGDGDSIIQSVELQQEDSVSTNYSLYSSEAYPSIFNLNTNSSVGDSGTYIREKVIINQPASATQGVLSAEDVGLLQSNPDAYIFFNGEIYNLNGKEHTAGYLTYSNIEYENNETTIKTITITLSTLSWVLTEDVVASKQYVNSQIGAIDVLLTQLNTGSGV